MARPVGYSHVVLQVADNPDQTLVTYSPASPSASAAAWAQTRDAP